jgi:hypothetical protein
VQGTIYNFFSCFLVNLCSSFEHRKAGVPQDVLRRAEELQQCFLNQSLLRPLTIPTHQKAISTRLTSFPDDSSDPTSYSGVSPHANSRDSGLSDYEQQVIY